MDRADAYAILDVPAQATPEEVRAAYRRRAFATHPDRAGGDAAAFRAVAEAYRSLTAPALDGAQEPAAASEPDTSPHVPPTDAAKVLFEYLSDLASEMILNGATPESVVSFLAREGCPESVARALERDLRDRIRRPAFPRWPWVAVASAAVAALLLGASFLARRARTPPVSATAPASAPARVAAAPIPAFPPSAPAPARPPPSAPARPSAKQPPRPPARERATAPQRGTSGELDAEREALEADQRRFAAEAAALAAESDRIDAEEAALASASDVERLAVLAPRKAAYNARIEAARRTEKALQRRVRELNDRITAYNERVRAER